MTRKCPYCSRNLLEDELYCFFCEQDVRKVIDNVVQPKSKPQKQSKVIAYCVKCKEKVNVKDPEYYVMKNNRLSIKGDCPTCTTKVFRILGLAHKLHHGRPLKKLGAKKKK